MSELLRTACEEARRGNSNIKQQVRDIGNRFLNNVEISAQEAGLHCTAAANEEIFSSSL